MIEFINIKKKIITLLKKYNIELENTLNEFIPIEITSAVNRYNFIINYQQCIPEDLLITLDVLDNYYPLTIINKKYNNVMSYITDLRGQEPESLKLPSIIFPYDAVYPALQMFSCGSKFKYFSQYDTKAKGSPSQIMKAQGSPHRAMKAQGSHHQTMKAQGSPQTMKAQGSPKSIDLLYYATSEDITLAKMPDFLNKLDYTVLKKGGDILIKINKLNTIDKLNVKDLQTALNKYNFTEYYFIYNAFPCIMQLYKNPIFLYISGYQENLNGTVIHIGPDIINIINASKEHAETFLDDISELPARSSETITKYILDNLISFYRNNLNLRINHLYLGKFQFTNWKKYLADYVDKEINVLELGVFEGIASVFFLGNLMGNVKSKFHLVDTWAGSVEYNRDMDWERIMNTFRMNVLNAPNNEKIVIHRKTSNEMLNRFIKQQMRFDVIFIDANHDSRAVILDAILSWKITRIGGTIIFDDYTWTKMPHEWERPKIALDAFLEIYQENIEVVYKRAQVMIRKISEYDKEIG